MSALIPALEAWKLDNFSRAVQNYEAKFPNRQRETVDAFGQMLDMGSMIFGAERLPEYLRAVFIKRSKPSTEATQRAVYEFSKQIITLINQLTQILALAVNWETLDAELWCRLGEVRNVIKRICAWATVYLGDIQSVCESTTVDRVIAEFKKELETVTDHYKLLTATAITLLKSCNIDIVNCTPMETFHQVFTKIMSGRYSYTGQGMNLGSSPSSPGRDKVPASHVSTYLHVPGKDDGTLKYKDLTDQIDMTGVVPYSFGGSADIYKGVWTVPSSGETMPIILKKLRVLGSVDPIRLERAQKNFDREVKVWMQLEHPNILQFLGVCRNLEFSQALVAPFCEGGNVEQYLESYPQADRLGIASDVACGLQYLHSKNVIHGDLKCENVLVKMKGIACICDFGISKILDQRGFTSVIGGTFLYLAPEQITENEYPGGTKSADVFAYGLVALQILTGVAPAGLRLVNGAIVRNINRKRYMSSNYKLSDSLWKLFEICCDQSPELRPTMEQVKQDLSNFKSGEQ